MGAPGVNNNNNKDSAALVVGPTKFWNNAIDLAKCDREEVKFSGAILPHGVLLVLEPESYGIIGVSANSEAWFQQSPAQLLGKRLDALVSQATQHAIEQALLNIVKPSAPAYLGCFQIQGRQRFDVFAHRSGARLLLEFEAVDEQILVPSRPDALHELAASAAKLQQATGFQQAVFIAAQELQRLTGFDSVVAVRFLADGSGQTIAEACEPSFPSFFDKRFPPSYVPEPARKQLLAVKQQYVPNLEYEPVALLMADTDVQPQQLDLGFAMLRSMSPLCSRYYINMGARSRFVLPLVLGGELWGFFACLHATQRPLSYATRFACQIFAGVTLQLLAEMEKSAQHRNAYLLNQRISELSGSLVIADDFQAALRKLRGQLLDTLDLSGVALYLDGKIDSIGLVPSETMLKALVPQLDNQAQLFASDHYPQQFDLDASFSNQTAGLIALRLQETGQYLLGFRLEWVREVYWAGDPAKPVAVDAAGGERRLTPRGSFEAWKEVVQGYARPWTSQEIDALTELQKALNLLQRTEKERAISVILEQANAEMDDRC